MLITPSPFVVGRSLQKDLNPAQSSFTPLSYRIQTNLNPPKLDRGRGRAPELARSSLNVPYGLLPKRRPSLPGLLPG